MILLGGEIQLSGYVKSFGLISAMLSAMLRMAGLGLRYLKSAGTS